MSDPKLYIIATPIGNRGDLTLRSFETLSMLEVIFAEDTRQAKKLLEMCKIESSKKKLYSYAMHNMKASTEKAISLMESGKTLGLVSDRGTPGICDPGYLLVRAARDRGFQVVPIPGASSVSTALSVSGMDCDRYFFLGFLPNTVSERRKMLDQAFSLQVTFCFFESPQRIRRTLIEIKEAYPKAALFLARELTKHFETLSSTTAFDLEPEKIVEKGEYVVVVTPHSTKQSCETSSTTQYEISLRAMTDRQWSKVMAEKYNIAASEFYNALQQKKASR